MSVAYTNPYLMWDEPSFGGDPLGYSMPSRESMGLPSRATQPATASGNMANAIGGAVGYLDNLVDKPARIAQGKLVTALNNLGSPATMIPEKANVLRMAGSPRALTALKIGGGLAAAGGVIGAGDVLFGGDSAANKIMDGTAMTIGGILGSAAGPMGIAAGAGIGKTISDGTQWLFGDKKTAEQRKMEEALRALKGGQY